MTEMRAFVTSRVLDAPRELVFLAGTDVAHLGRDATRLRARAARRDAMVGFAIEGRIESPVKLRECVEAHPFAPRA